MSLFEWGLFTRGICCQGEVLDLLGCYNPGNHFGAYYFETLVCVR